jgi:hypothetical protein
MYFCIRYLSSIGCSGHVAHARTRRVKVRGIIAAARRAAQYISPLYRTVPNLTVVGSPRFRAILGAVFQQRPRCDAFPRGPVEVHVRTARLTDLDAAVRLLASGEPTGQPQRSDVADVLRTLLFVPSATVVVAEAERRVVGIGVLAIRPSVRSGPFVGVIDELGLVAQDELEDAERARVADEIIEALAGSARNKGCTRVEVNQPLASAEPSLWKRHRFASLGTSVGRSLD